jgi:predicted MPP superfamily phosphohydrolase
VKYSDYIELSANYESVVDLDAEERNPNLWQDYIVHEDMQKAIDAVCMTMNWEDNDKRRSFWIHGAYGTGKSYAAIVLKHLFEDKISEIQKFMERPSLAKYKTRFTKIRQKGEFLVVWKSGTTDIKSGTQLMMEMEVKIKEKLKEKFGEKAYYGANSLMNAAKEAVSNEAINWNSIFNNPLYDLSDEYADVDDFRTAVDRGKFSAINKVKRICDDLHFSMFADTVEKFEEWLKDIITGNGLENTGIVFIWDEFTAFLRDCGDDNVLQRLSEFCKQAPFFMCLIVHRDPTWVDQLGGETYERILHRYHELEFHITESAAYELIGDSIIPRTGMGTQWAEIKKELLSSIEKWKFEFDNLEQGININEHIALLCPLHPMTVSMLATVAQNFGASQRTLFRFMKDRAESSQGVGFIHYIENNNPDEWKWLTVDYLWDYFFTRNSDVRDFNLEVRKVIQHFQNKAESISDEYAMHVFKAALLLIAVLSGSNISNLYSRTHKSGRISATKNTLYKCFRGQLEQSTIDNYLTSFEEIGLLRMDKQRNGDARLELPYTGNTDAFEVRLEMAKKKYTRYALFSERGTFSKALENNMWDGTKATFGRVYIAVCSNETNSFNVRLGEVRKELQKYPYKIGMLVVSTADASEYASFQSKVRQVAAEDDSKRLVIALLREPCADDVLDRWREAITHMELAAEEGKSGSSNKYAAEASGIIAMWSATAADSQIYACYGDIQFTGLYGKNDLIKRIERDVLYNVFPAAPERLVMANTAFKKCNDSVAFAGLTKSVSNNQVNNIVNSLKAIGAWDIDDLEGFKSLSGDNTEPITELAKFFQQEFSQGAKIPLDILWAKLQTAPFGYYNSMAAGCFIGLIMRSLVNGSFNWIDSSNNTHLPTAGNLASMINKMLSGISTNNYLSSGSAIWQQFKPYIQKLFDLTPQDVVSDAEARKYAKQRITGIGVPFWALKYLSSEKYGGDDAKKAAIKIVDHFCDFLYEVTEDQENVMSETYSLFNGRGALRGILTDALADKTSIFHAFKKFMFFEAPELKDLCAVLDLTDKDLFDALRSYLQDSISAWREEQVIEKLGELVRELRVIAVFKNAIGENIKTYSAIQYKLNNVFEHMKIPGTVVETLSYSWIPTLKLMRQLSRNAWSDIPDKDDVELTLQNNVMKVLENITQPKLLLEAVLNARNISYTDDELDWIYGNLKPQAYETPATTFEAHLNRLLESISYNRNAALVKELWQSRTGTATRMVQYDEYSYRVAI